FAQEERRTDLGRTVPCPHPTKLVINGHNPATVIPGEIPAATTAAVAGSVFNQTQINKDFGYTFTFPVCPKECCLWTTAYLQVTFKALQGGPPGSATSANDYVSIWVNGAAVVDRKSTRLNSSHLVISYAVFCLKKKKKSFLIDRHTMPWDRASFRSVPPSMHPTRLYHSCARTSRLILPDSIASCLLSIAMSRPL